MLKAQSSGTYVQFKLDTAILHIAHITPRLIRPNKKGTLMVFKHIQNWFLLKPIYRERQGIIEEAEIQSSIILLTLLPLQVGIRSSR